MRFLSIIKSAERGLTPPEALITAIGKMIQTSLQDGSLVQTGGLAGSAKGVRVRVAGKKLTVTDGPFAEAKEVIGGYAVLEAPTREGRYCLHEGVHAAAPGALAGVGGGVRAAADRLSGAVTR